MATGQKKYRLVTRSDFDGIACAALLKELDMVDEIKFVHPRDMQEGKVEITDSDITANLPYVEGVHLAFDHHLSETERVAKRKNHIINPDAMSTAFVIYNHYGGKAKFPRISDELMDAVDRGDSARFTESNILRPKGWVLLHFLMDPRTGLGRFRNFRISNYDLMMQLVDLCRDHTAEQILQTPDVAERRQLYFEHEGKFKEQIQRCARAEGDTVVIDLRNEDPIWAGNRFMIYALYPECTVSVHVMWGLQKQNTAFAVGKSIINRLSQCNIGSLMLEYGGGGQEAVGTCQVENERADQVLKEILQKIAAAG